MARDFSKNVANYLTLGDNVVGPLLHGAAYLMASAWVNLDSIDTTAYNNRVLQLFVNTTRAGLILCVHNGTSAVLRAAARSTSADGLQAKDGTTVLSTGTWYQIGAIIDIGGDTITPYVNGVAEGGGAVTFGAATYTDGTPSAGVIDSIGSSISGSVPTGTADQVDGRIAEVAIWASATAFTAADQEAMAARFSPCMVRRDALKFYMPLLGVDSPERDHWGGLSGTITGTVAAADHPNIIYPSGVISIRSTAPTAGGSNASPVIGGCGLVICAA